MNNVYILKLVSGEEIIGEYVIKSDIYHPDDVPYMIYNEDKVKLRNVFLVSTHIQDGKALCYLDPFMLYSNTSMFTFRRQHIITVTQASEIATEYYFKVAASMEEAKKTVSLGTSDGKILH